MGLSSSKSKTTTNSNETSTATTTPNNPQWVTDAVQGWSKQVSDFGKTDPYSLVAGPSALQQQAFNGAALLSGNTAATVPNLMALQGVQNVANAPANLALGTGYTAQNFGGANTGPAQNYTASGYNAALSDPATLAQAQTKGYEAKGYTAASASAAQIAAIERAQAEKALAASMLDGFDKYQSPTTQALVDTTLADFDQDAGRTRAQQAAAAARNGAFGGSRYGIQEAATEGELARARAATDAQVRDTAFTRSVGMAQYDATNRQNTNALNAQLGTNVNIANAGFENNRLATNAQMATNVSMANAGFANDANRFTADAQNRAGEFGANAFNQASLFNAGQQNTNTWRNQDSLNTAGQFNANALNTAGQFNTGQNNQFALTNAGFKQQAGLANMDANNAASQFGANAYNQMNMFNAGQKDNSLDRQLAAASLGSQIGNNMDANTRANLGLMGDLGSQQQALEQLKASAPAMYMELMGQLQGTQNFGLFNGQTVSGSSTMNGTSTTKSSPSLYSILSDMAAKAAQAAAAGSDRRLKKDIEPVGTHEGLNLYAYRYNWENGPKRVGVMADEVAKLRPDALGPEMMDGYQSVNYAKLGLAHLVEA